MKIFKSSGTITRVTPLSPTAKEVTISLESLFECPPGSFINLFISIEGETLRRAYSVVSANVEQKTITIAVRLTPTGKVTPQFWKDSILGNSVTVMGPFGSNTGDKLSKPNLFLFGFGIGAGVIKSIAAYAIDNPVVEKIVIVTGSRAEDDIIYKEYFELLAKNPKVTATYVVSNPIAQDYAWKGYIQDHVSTLDFSDADIYMCGQVKACDALQEKIGTHNPHNCSFFVEAFH